MLENRHHQPLSTYSKINKAFDWSRWQYRKEPELTSSHVHTESTPTHRVIHFEEELKPGEHLHNKV